MSVERVTFIGIDNHNKETRVGMDQLGLVTGLQVPEDGSIIEEGEVDHILAFLELGWIDLSKFFGFENLFLDFRML